MPLWPLHILAVDKMESRDGCALTGRSLNRNTAQAKATLHPCSPMSPDSPLMQVFAKGENHKYTTLTKVSVINRKSVLNTLFLVFADPHVQSSISWNCVCSSATEDERAGLLCFCYAGLSILNDKYHLVILIASCLCFLFTIGFWLHSTNMYYCWQEK